LPTVVDSLVITLGLDSKAVVQGVKEANAALAQLKTGASTTIGAMRQTADTARKTGQEMSSSGIRAAEFFTEMRNKALSLIAVLVGGRGLQSIIKDTATSVADLGRSAQNIRMPAADIRAFASAVEAGGGNAQEATGTLLRLQDQLTRLRLMGQGSSEFKGVLGQLGLTGAEGPDVVIGRLMRANVGNDVKRLWGQILGLDQGTINLVMQGAKGEEMLARARRRGAPTQEEIRNQQEFQNAWNNFSQSLARVTELIINDLAPPLTKFLNTISDWTDKHQGTAQVIGEILGGLAIFAGTVLTARAGLGTLRMAGRMIGLGRGAGAVAGIAGAVAGEGGLMGAAAALTGAAEALMAAAAALGGGGTVGAAENALGAAAGAGRGRALTASGGRLAASTAPRGLFGRMAAVLGGRAAGFLLPAAGFVAGMWPSSTQTQEQENRLLGRSAGTGAFGVGTSAQQHAFAEAIGRRESGGRYGIMGGDRGHFAGKYQMGATEIAETARSLGEPVPSTQQFLSDPAMQERYFAAYTAGHDRYLASHSSKYASASPADKMGYLAVAHLLGPGAAMRSLSGQDPGSDAFRTRGSTYFDIGRNAAMQVSQAQRGGGQQMAMAGGGDQTVHVNGPIVINTQATDSKGIARSIRSDLAGRRVAQQAATGLA